MLVITVKPHKVFQVGDAKISIQRAGGSFKVSISAPQHITILRPGLLPREPKVEVDHTASPAAAQATA